MKGLAFVALMILGLASGFAATRDVDKYFFDTGFGDFKSELETARKQGKRGILLMFELDDCPFCHRMKQTVLNRSEVQDFYKRHFLIFTVNVKGDVPLVDFKGRETTEKAFALGLRVHATPVFQFFDLEGNPTVRFTGATRDAAEFLQLGRYVVDGAYRTADMSFAKYKQRQAE